MSPLIETKRPPIVVLHAARVASFDGRAGQPENHAEGMPGDRVDAVAPGGSVHLVGAAPDTPGVPRTDEPGTDVEQPSPRPKRKPALPAAKALTIDQLLERSSMFPHQMRSTVRAVRHLDASIRRKAILSDSEVVVNCWKIGRECNA
jgi:hypothetical protein